MTIRLSKLISEELDSRDIKLMGKLGKLLTKDGFKESKKPIGNEKGIRVHKTWTASDKRFVEVYDVGDEEPWVTWGHINGSNANDPLTNWVLDDIEDELLGEGALKEASMTDVQNNWFVDLGVALEKAIKSKSKQYVDKTSRHDTKKSSYMQLGVYLQAEGATSADLMFKVGFYIFEKDRVVHANIEAENAFNAGATKVNLKFNPTVDEKDIVKKLSDWLDNWLRAN